MNPKITHEHLLRRAVVYVRQSSVAQVLEQRGKPPQPEKCNAREG